MSLNLYATPLVACTLGINPRPVPDANGDYHVRLGTVNERSLEGPYLQAPYSLVDRAMQDLVGKDLGEYRYSRATQFLQYVRYSDKRQTNIIRPYYRLLSYTLTREAQKIHIDGVVRFLDPVRLHWVLNRDDGLVFSMRSKVSLQGLTKSLRAIVSFDLESRKYIEDKLLWRVTGG